MVFGSPIDRGMFKEYAQNPQSRVFVSLIWFKDIPVPKDNMIETKWTVRLNGDWRAVTDRQDNLVFRADDKLYIVGYGEEHRDLVLSERKGSTMKIALTLVAAVTILVPATGTTSFSAPKTNRVSVSYVLPKNPAHQQI